MKKRVDERSILTLNTVDPILDLNFKHAFKETKSKGLHDHACQQNIQPAFV